MYMLGGGVGVIDIGICKLNLLMMFFKFVGLNLDVMLKFMVLLCFKYMVCGNFFDVCVQFDIFVVGIIEGKMIKVDINEFKKDFDVGFDYEIKEVVFYQLMIGGKEKYYFDFFVGFGGICIDGFQLFCQVVINVGFGV